MTKPKLPDPAAYVGNILAVYEQADRLTREAGALWYPTESDRCADFAARHNLTLHAVAGAAAAISPGLKWETTFAHLEALLAHPRSHKVPTYSKEFVRRAVRILKGAEPLQILSGPKVTAFYSLLSTRGASDAVVVDGHAWNICRGTREVFRANADYQPSASVQVTAKRYRDCVTAFRAAGVLLNLPAHAVQAITWVQWRKPDQSTTDMWQEGRE